jgi:hypothetical protein
VGAAKSLRSSESEAKAASTKKAPDEGGGARAISPTAAVSSDEVEKARGRFHDALEKAMTLGDGGADGDPVGRLGMFQEARHRVSLERLAYEDVRQRFDWQERRAATDEMQRLALATLKLAERQTGYAKSHFVLSILVGVAVAAQAMILVWWAWRRH